MTMVDSYDAVGNRTGRVKDGVVTTWLYDPGYRLLNQQTAGGYATFAYDGAGNILTKWNQGSSSITGTYDAADRTTTVLQGATLTTFSWSHSGYMNKETVGTNITSYGYDPEFRLNQVLYPDGTQSVYKFDSYTGLRRTKLEPGGVLTSFIWDGSDYLGEA